MRSLFKNWKLALPFGLQSCGARHLLAWGLFSWLLYYYVQAVMLTMGWGQAHDAPIMSYCAWRILQGDAPYRDIFDMNFPVTYLMHMLVLTVFGYSDFALRCFDLVWLAVTAAGIIAFCRPQGWFTGAFAALCYMCFHLSMGNNMFAQRDFIMAGFLIWAFFFAGRIVDGEKKTSSAFFMGLLLGLAAWLKPVGFVLLVLILLYFAFKKRFAVVLWAMAGFALVSLMMVGWLLSMGALGAFITLMLEFVLPIYPSMGFWIGSKDLYYRILHYNTVFFVFFLLPVGGTPRYQLLILGVVYGLLHSILQVKGWNYHFYPSILFIGLAAIYRVGECMRADDVLIRNLTMIVLIFACYLFGPMGSVDPEIITELQRPWIDTLVSDLESLKLGKEDTVQVMDTTGGGIEALNRLKIRQPTRFIYDFPLLNNLDEPVTARYRKEFLDGLEKAMPKVVVVSYYSWPDEDLGYARMAVFPEMVALLATHYSLFKGDDAFKIYVRLPSPETQ